MTTNSTTATYSNNLDDAAAGAGPSRPCAIEAAAAYVVRLIGARGSTGCASLDDAIATCADQLGHSVIDLGVMEMSDKSWCIYLKASNGEILADIDLTSVAP